MFSFVYPDKRGRMVLRDVGVTFSTRRNEDETKTLDSLHFETGDFLAVSIFA
jgi:histone deacetylase complex subunit SAP18